MNLNSNDSIKHTRTSNIRCGITLDDGNDSRFRFECNHVVSREGLKLLVEQSLSENSPDILCRQSGCTLQIPYNFIRSQLALSEPPSYLSLLDECVQENDRNWKSHHGIRCPRCSQVTVVDQKNKHIRTSKVYCSCKDGENDGGFSFCKLCRMKWPSNNTSNICSSSLCSYRIDLYNKALEMHSSEDNNFVPTLRACPMCHSLIYRTRGCSRVACPDCKHDFCFKCLNDYYNHQHINCHKKDTQHL